MIRRVINKKSNMIVALIISLTIILAATLAINGTFAAPNDINVEIQRLNNYQELEKNTIDEFLTAGIADYELSDYSIATASINKNTGIVKLTGKKAGVVTLALGTKGGLTFIVNYQITDSTNISKYITREKGEVTLAQAGSYKDTLVTVTEGTNNIKWKSLNTSVATVNENTGRIAAVAKGTAIVLGTFTDKWGVVQDIHILVGVAVNLNGSNLGELIDLVNKGEETLASNPNPYDENSLTALQNAVDKGKNVLNSNNPIDSVINNAIKDLKDALNSLKLKPGGGNIVKGPDGNHYRPVGKPPNVYEVVDEDGNSKYPPEYVYNPNGKPGNGKDSPAHLHNGSYWVEDPKDSNIWKEVDNSGNLKENNAIWGGADGKPGGGDDKPVTKFGGSWWVSMGQNVWCKVTGKYTLGALTGGGSSEDPSVTPVSQIFDNTKNDGKYYIGQLGPDGDGNYYFYGDKPTGSGGDGKLNSEKDYLHSSDQKYYLSEDGKTMTTTPPSKAGTITSVTITGPTSVTTSSSEQYNATVSGTGGPVSQEVTWQVSGSKAGTIINNGVLTVADDETATKLTIKAASVVSPAIFKEYEIAVTKKDTGKGIPGLNGKTPGTIVKIDDIEWVLVKTQYMSQSQRYVALLLLNNVLYPNTNGTTYADNKTQWSTGDNTNASNVQLQIDGWYLANISSMPMLKKYALKQDIGSSPSASWIGDGNTLLLAGNDTARIAFIPRKADVFPHLNTAQLQLTTPQNPASNSKIWWTNTTATLYGATEYKEYLKSDGTWGLMHYKPVLTVNPIYARPCIWVIAD